jgi:hypothetical protein
VQSDKVIFTRFYGFDDATYKWSRVAALMKFLAIYISLKSGAVPVVGFFLSMSSRPRSISNSQKSAAVLLGSSARLDYALLINRIL